MGWRAAFHADRATRSSVNVTCFAPLRPQINPTNPVPDPSSKTRHSFKSNVAASQSARTTQPTLTKPPSAPCAESCTKSSGGSPREQPTRPPHVDVALQSPAAKAQNAGITRLAREGDLSHIRGMARVRSAVDEDVVASMAMTPRVVGDVEDCEGMACSTVWQSCQQGRHEAVREACLYTPSQQSTTSNGLSSSHRFASQLRETPGRHPPR